LGQKKPKITLPSALKDVCNGTDWNNPIYLSEKAITKKEV